MMKDKVFQAYEVKITDNGEFKGSIIDKHVGDLSDRGVLIRVAYSSLNYKDALSSIGSKGVTKTYPHTPGIDASGVVVHSIDERFHKGDEVIVTGYDLGMNTPGGFGEYISVPGDWVVPLPKGLSLREAMVYGTAGFTAALSVHKVVSHGIKPEDGEILVTGGTGGVGSVAVTILSRLGYRVIASTGKENQKALLLELGAKDIILRNQLQAKTNRPMLKSIWAGVVDTVGGQSLSNGIKGLMYRGCATCCGNVGGHVFDASVYPFILRGVTLYGIDSVMCPMDERLLVWQHLATDWNVTDVIETNDILLKDVQKYIDLILEGNHIGRTIIRHRHTLLD